MGSSQGCFQKLDQYPGEYRTKVVSEDDQSFQRAIRNRKKILKRRQRARERAAAAASGAKAATVAAKNPAPVPVEDDANPGYEAPHDDVIAANAKQTRVKEGDRGPGIGQGVGHGGSGQAALG